MEYSIRHFFIERQDIINKKGEALDLLNDILSVIEKRYKTIDGQITISFADRYGILHKEKKDKQIAV